MTPTMRNRPQMRAVLTGISRFNMVNWLFSDAVYGYD